MRNGRIANYVNGGGVMHASIVTAINNEKISSAVTTIYGNKTIPDGQPKSTSEQKTIDSDT